jgi:hypothetical protein
VAGGAGMTPQAQRVLDELRRGARTRVDFLRPADGGPPVLNVAARILELRRAGHVIVSGGRRDACKVYRLLGLRIGEG